MSYKSFLVFCFISVLIVACGGGGGGLEMTSQHYNSPPSNLHRSLSVEPTLENCILFSSDIFIGQVVEISELGAPEVMFVVEVHEVIASDSNDMEMTVLVRAHGEELNIGDRYIFFADLVSHTAYPYDYYNLYEFMILKITAEDSLLRLTDPGQQTFIAPFKSDKYNQLRPLIGYIIEYRGRIEEKRSKELSASTRAIKSLDSWDVLFEQADHVVMMEIDRIYAYDKYCAEAFITIIKDYKPRQWQVRSIIVPAYLQPGQTYIIFLNSIGVPITRQDSILAEDHPKFLELREWLKTQIDD